MRAFVAVVLSVTAIVAGATSASAADLRYAPRYHHARYAPEPCSPCQVGWRFSPPIAYVGYWLGHGPWAPQYYHRHHRWAGGCDVGPRPCYHGWRKRGLVRYVAPGRYQLVQQKEYIGEPVLLVQTVGYVGEPRCGSRCRW